MCYKSGTVACIYLQIHDGHYFQEEIINYSMQEDGYPGNIFVQIGTVHLKSSITNLWESSKSMHHSVFIYITYPLLFLLFHLFIPSLFLPFLFPISTLASPTVPLSPLTTVTSSSSCGCPTRPI